MIKKFFFIDKHIGNRFYIYLFGIKLFRIKLKIKNISLKQINSIQKSFLQIERKLKIKFNNKEKLKITFLVSNSSMFPAKPLFDYLYKNKQFIVSLIIIPDYRFDVVENMKKTINDLQNYKSVMIISPTEKETDKIDLNQISDIIVPSLPYDVSHSKYDLLKLIKKGLLPIIINYGYFRSYYDRTNIISNNRSCLYWKIFVESTYNMNEYKNYQAIKGKNTVLTGYCKMDSLINYQSNTKKERKVILIAPHHSISGGYNDSLNLSNFQKYANFFLNLPKIYKNIDFIFRPHPALFPCLSQDKFWGKEKVNKYITEIKKYPNVIYSDKGDYFHDFAISDAIIQDCGSYLVEYFYTKKPCCYMLKNTSDTNNKFTQLGKECLKYCYIAYNEDDIYNFIQNVVVKGQDNLKTARNNFAENNIMLNYPNVSSIIANYLINYFKIK